LATSTFESVGINKGDFILNSTASFVGSGNGDYAQNIDYLSIRRIPERWPPMR